MPTVLQSIAIRLNSLLVTGESRLAREEGQGMVEYILILGVVSIAIVVAAKSPLSTAITDTITRVSTVMTTS